MEITEKRHLLVSLFQTSRVLRLCPLWMFVGIATCLIKPGVWLLAVVVLKLLQPTRFRAVSLYLPVELSPVTHNTPYYVVFRGCISIA